MEFGKLILSSNSGGKVNVIKAKRVGTQSSYITTYSSFYKISNPQLNIIDFKCISFTDLKTTANAEDVN